MSHPPRPLDCVLVKPAGPDCNMACGYCFYLPKHRLFPDKMVHRMTAEVLDRTVRQVMQSGNERSVFAWQGGEPTLMGVEFFERAVELQRAWGRTGQIVGNGLQTNGLLIDERWCRFLRDAQFLVGLSLDGPAPVHDHFRVGRGGEPTWSRVVESARRLLAAGVEVNALAVVNAHSAGFARDTYTFLRDLGLPNMQFVPCLEPDPRHADRPAPFSVSADRYGEFLCELFDCWRADFEDGRPTTFIRWFESVFATYVGVPPPECSLQPECGRYLVVEHNGDVFSCDFFVEPAYRLGNVCRDDLLALLNSSQQARFGRQKAALPRVCHECRWLTRCRGGCPRERFGGPPGPQPSRLCQAYQAFFNHADGVFNALAEDWRRANERMVGDASDVWAYSRPPLRAGRNDPCPCGSGRKLKKCCGAQSSAGQQR